MKLPALRVLIAFACLSQYGLVVAQSASPPAVAVPKSPILLENLRILGAKGGEDQFPAPGGGGTGTGTTGTGSTGTGGRPTGTGNTGLGSTGFMAPVPTRVDRQPSLLQKSSP